MNNIEYSKQCRRETFELMVKHKQTHFGGSMSLIEILVALEKVVTPDDKVILSKGHASYPFYLFLKRKGCKPKMHVHPSMDCKNGVYCTTGSLGHGLPLAIGMALARKRMNKKGNIYVIISDGEMQEGTTWESLLIAVHHNLDNLIVILDNNGYQALDEVTKILNLEPLSLKLEAFNWSYGACDGHDVYDILYFLQEKIHNDQPLFINARTYKGHGISYMKNDARWHNRFPNDEEIKIAREELG